MPKHFQNVLDKEIRAIELFEKNSVTIGSKISDRILEIPRKRMRSQAEAFLDLKPETLSLIDIGCGSGYYSLKAKSLGIRVYSVDASSAMVLRIQDKVDEAEVSLIEALEIERAFDRVVCQSALAFTTNPEIAVRHLCKLVAPGGRLVILCPRRSWGGLLYQLMKRFLKTPPRLFTKEWLVNLAQVEGLVLVDYAEPLPSHLAICFDRRK